MHLEETKAKLKNTRRKIEAYKTGKKTPQKIDLKICLDGLGLRVKKLEQKQTELQNHVDNSLGNWPQRSWLQRKAPGGANSKITRTVAGLSSTLGR